MNKKYIVRLNSEERRRLMEIVTRGKAPAHRIRHANILLKADVDGPAWSDRVIAQAFSAHANTVALVRQRFVEHGLEAALNRKEQRRPSREPRLDKEAEAILLKLRCTDPPAGHSQWTLRLLAQKLVELGLVDTICHETVRQVLKRREDTPCSDPAPEGAERTKESVGGRAGRVRILEESRVKVAGNSATWRKRNLSSATHLFRKFAPGASSRFTVR